MSKIDEKVIETALVYEQVLSLEKQANDTAKANADYISTLKIANEAVHMEINRIMDKVKSYDYKSKLADSMSKFKQLSGAIVEKIKTFDYKGLYNRMKSDYQKLSQKVKDFDINSRLEGYASYMKAKHIVVSFVERASLNYIIKKWRLLGFVEGEEMYLSKDHNLFIMVVDKGEFNYQLRGGKIVIYRKKGLFFVQEQVLKSDDSVRCFGDINYCSDVNSEMIDTFTVECLLEKEGWSKITYAYIAGLQKFVEVIDLEDENDDNDDVRNQDTSEAVASHESNDGTEAEIESVSPLSAVTGRQQFMRTTDDDILSIYAHEIDANKIINEVEARNKDERVTSGAATVETHKLVKAVFIEPAMLSDENINASKDITNESIITDTSYQDTSNSMTAGVSNDESLRNAVQSGLVSITNNDSHQNGETKPQVVNLFAEESPSEEISDSKSDGVIIYSESTEGLTKEPSASEKK